MKVRSQKSNVKKNRRPGAWHHWLIVLLMVVFAHPSSVCAQKYSVASFRMLPNDVSAFINNVRDLNDEACALIKVEAPADFAFSSPLGIVKRKDEVGEIWIYLPKGTKMLTLKHPEWGVIRNFPLGKPLESRMTYELKLNLPKPEVTEVHDTIIEVKTVVDTVMIQKTKKIRTKMPLSIYTLATLALHEDGPSYGLLFAMMHRHGFFLHASSNLKKEGTTVGSCDELGFTEGINVKPYYTGNTRHANYTLTVGGIHHLFHGICLFEGIGYGKTATAWELAQSEGGGYLHNNGLSHKGMAAEIGALASIGRVSIAASAITIAGKQWQANIGIGIKLGKSPSK